MHMSSVSLANGGQMVGGTKWLLELDGALQHIMKISGFGHNHTDLRNIAQELH